MVRSRWCGAGCYEGAMVECIADSTADEAATERQPGHKRVMRHMLTCTGQVLYVTRHVSHVTRHTSHVTRHTSHVTRHTSHVTRHAAQELPDSDISEDDLSGCEAPDADEVCTCE